MIRLDKYLADMQAGTRSEVKQMIRKGRVWVNQQPEKSPDRKINPETDQVALDQKTVAYAAYEYYLFNKPSGCVSATEDNLYPTVLDYIETKKRKDLFPVGRLDLDTEGLLLITNDGGLAHELLSPAHHIPKTYYAKIDGIITEKEQQLFSQGMDIGEKKPTQPALLKILKSDSVSEVEITICEGKYHQIKRMFLQCSKPVLYLKRISMGNLTLDDKLLPGEYRSLTEPELTYLKNRRESSE